MSKDIMGIGRIQEEINNAPEVQSAAELLQEVKKCSRQLVAVCDATETLCEKTDKLDTTLDKRLDDIRNASTVVIPPETIQHLTEVQNNFCRMFSDTIEKQGTELVGQLDNRYQKMERRIAEHERVIRKQTERITVPDNLFYCFATTFVLLAMFFGIVFWVNCEFFHIKRLQSLSWIFLAFMVISNSAIIGFTVWYNHRR